ncbi:chemotaxis protein CheA [Fulvivirga ligni]|uniref:chemotaxis protein CheA n=1 Tax=Fulvivirga ligni TaxID=2904246 RepID=UPI001F4762DB|nr:chemotaxis protein CheA [Fulvivirga ligni]UII20768.1 chemotaxis protein CheA [Fulvivirga ligni]
MDQLQKTFLLEAEELITDLEEALLAQEQDLHNEAHVKEIFRILHSLKGGGSMFGFNTISTVTHHLESIYDEIRNHRLAPTKEILNITFEALDHIKATLHDQELSIPRNKANHDKINARIEVLIGEELEAEYIPNAEPSVITTYYILIQPKSTIFQNGTNPLYLVDDVISLGTGIVLPSLSKAPYWDTLNPELCFTDFEIILATSEPESEIEDVFIFAQDQCELSIQTIGEGSLLELDGFKLSLLSKPINAEIYGYETIEELAKTYINERTKPKPQSNGQPKLILESSIRVPSSKLDELMDLTSELVTTQAQLSLIAEKLKAADLIDLSESFEKITRRLKDNTFSMCLVPVETMISRFRRLVRDLSNTLEKEVNFKVTGSETELDKAIIESISDPILHLIRNSMDHGLEQGNEREKLGKPAQGTLEFKAYHSGPFVFIQIIDDGKGIDPAKVRKKALQNGLEAAKDQNDQEVLQMIFTPGFSTAEEVTDISGRGVGMDVVKRKIESLKGEVNIESTVNIGTTITIKLPLTLSIIDGMVVQISGNRYVIPLPYVDKCLEIKTNELTSAISQKQIIDGMSLQLFHLRSYFNEEPYDEEITQVIKLNYNQRAVAISIDFIIGQFQTVVKPLSKHYASQPEFSGASVLGDGGIALILDINRLIQALINENNI